MNEDYEHHPRRKRRWLSGCLVILGTVVLMAVIAWLLLGASSDRSTEALRAKGYPTTLVELNAWYVEPPIGENAAGYYLEAGKLFENASFSDYDNLPIQGQADLPPLGTPIPDEMRAVVRAFLDHEVQAFELIDEGSEFEEVRYPANFNMAPGSVLFPHLTSVRNLVRGQNLRTLYHSGQSDVDTLLAEYDKLVGVSRSLRNEPMLLANMVNVALIGMTVSTTERMLNENDFTTEQLKQLDSSLALLMDDDALARAFIGERCFGTSMMASQNRIPVVGGIFRADYVGAIDDFIEIAEEGLPLELDAYKSRLNQTYSYFRPFSSLISEPFTRNIESYYETHALIMAARVAIAIQNSRLDGGDLPGSADGFPESVLSAWSIDPFSGEPLIYKQFDEGFIVYSVGGNMVDDEGIFAEAGPDEHRKRGMQDVVFRILK